MPVPADGNGKRRDRKRRANGQGSIYQRADGLWVGAAYVLMPDGTRRRRPVYGKSADIVQDKLVKMQTDSSQGVPAEATGWTVERYLTYWLQEVVKPELRSNTYITYEKAVRIYLIPGLGKKRLNKLTAVDVRRFIRNFEGSCLCCVNGKDESRVEKKRRCCAVAKCCRSLPSKRLVQVVHAVLRNALQAAMREELIRRNVAKLVQVSIPKYGIDRGLTSDQARVLLKVAADHRLRALVVIALYLGLRRGELLGLQWSDVDFDKKTLTVRHTLLRIGGALRLEPTKSDDSERTLPLLGLVEKALLAHRDAQRDEREAAGKAWVNSGHVFTTKIGTAIDPDNLRRAWFPLRQAADLEGVVFHGLRHTCVTLLLDLGVPPHIVRDIAGHSAIEVTMTIYAHTSMDDKRRALGKLDDHLG